jgi:hypothetical protein
MQTLQSPLRESIVGSGILAKMGISKRKTGLFLSYEPPHVDSLAEAGLALGISACTLRRDAVRGLLPGGRSDDGLTFIVFRRGELERWRADLDIVQMIESFDFLRFPGAPNFWSERLTVLYRLSILKRLLYSKYCKLGNNNSQ